MNTGEIQKSQIDGSVFLYLIKYCFAQNNLPNPKFLAIGLIHSRDFKLFQVKNTKVFGCITMNSFEDKENEKENCRLFSSNASKEQSIQKTTTLQEDHLVSTPASTIMTPISSNYWPTGFVHCALNRDSKGTSYQLMFQTKRGGKYEQIAMVAEKQSNLSNTLSSKYHIFDTFRIPSHSSSISKGMDNIVLNKKSGNYLGKLKKINNANAPKDKASYVLYNANSEKEEIMAVTYDKISLVKHMIDGQPPRKFKCVLPHVSDKSGKIEPMPPYMKNRMVESIEREIATGLIRFESKEPSYEKNQYRLNFNGRVTMPSCKNMQLINHKDCKFEGPTLTKDKNNDDINANRGDGKGTNKNVAAATTDNDNEEASDEIFVQFGKIGENSFHLDFKYPLNALQAFALALTALDY